MKKRKLVLGVAGLAAIVGVAILAYKKLKEVEDFDELDDFDDESVDDIDELYDEDIEASFDDASALFGAEKHDIKPDADKILAGMGDTMEFESFKQVCGVPRDEAIMTIIANSSEYSEEELYTMVNSKLAEVYFSVTADK